MALTGVLGWKRFWCFPSLFWLAGSDFCLTAAAALGAVCSLLLIVGCLLPLMLLLLWLLNLLRRLLEGSRPVLALLLHNPFAEGPPAFVRLVLYRYRSTDFSTRRRTGEWWRRTRIGAYPPFNLQSFRPGPED